MSAGSGPREAGWSRIVARFARRFLAAAVVLLLPLASARAGDADLAKVLLEGGKKAIDKKQYDDAVVKLERARSEDPSLLEAGYWLAVAHDKKGAGPQALRAYRAFREACRAAREKGALEKDVESLAKKADTRLATLAAAETELAKLNEPFVTSSVAFAKTNFLRDPALALKALSAALALDPGHDEAKRLLEKLRVETGLAPEAEAGKPAEGLPKASKAYPDIKRWRDLLADKAFGTYETWSYGPKGLTIDSSGSGSFHWPAQAVRTPARYVLEMEVSMKRTTTPWALGFGFAKGATDHLAMFISGTELISHRFKGNSRDALARPGFLQPMPPDTWHRFAVDVTGTKVKAWIDEQMVVEADLPDLPTLAGDVAVYHQNNRCEIRALRLGTKD